MNTDIARYFMANNEPVSHFELEYAGFFVQEADELGGVIGRHELYAGLCRGNSKETIPVRGSWPGFYYFQGLVRALMIPFILDMRCSATPSLTAFDEWKCNFVCFFSAFDLADDCCRVTGEVEFCGREI